MRAEQARQTGQGVEVRNLGARGLSVQFHPPAPEMPATATRVRSQAQRPGHARKGQGQLQQPGLHEVGRRELVAIKAQAMAHQIQRGAQQAWPGKPDRAPPAPIAAKCGRSRERGSCPSARDRFDLLGRGWQVAVVSIMVGHALDCSKGGAKRAGKGGGVSSGATGGACSS